MFTRTIAGVFLGALLLGGNPAFAGNAPTLHQVYAAAQSGHLAEAEQMMTVVLQQHPDSAKAHYVDAEVLSREGKLAAARTELAQARRIDPALSFAAPAAVSALEASLSGSAAVPAAAAAQHRAGFPWGLVLFGLAAIMLVFWIVRAMTARRVAMVSPGPYYSGPNGMPGTPYGNGPMPMGGAPYGGAPVMPMGGGAGSGIMSGLVTGAAVGAGMVAGEALAHRLMDGGSSADSGVIPAASANDWASSANSDMGGADFGVSDAGSWDDGSGFGGGGDDWS